MITTLSSHDHDDVWFASYFNQTIEEISDIIVDIANNKHVYKNLYIIDFKEPGNWTKEQFDYALHLLIERMNHEFFGILGRAQAIVFGIVYALIITFGVITNASIICIFFRSKKLRTFRNMYIINLAIR
jgi:hypothetical protein